MKKNGECSRSRVSEGSKIQVLPHPTRDRYSFLRQICYVDTLQLLHHSVGKSIFIPGTSVGHHVRYKKKKKRKKKIKAAILIIS